MFRTNFAVWSIKAPTKTWTGKKECGWLLSGLLDFGYGDWLEGEGTLGGFLNSLNEGLKCELATKELPKSLEALVNICNRLNDHMREYGRRPWEWPKVAPTTSASSFSSGGEGVEHKPWKEEDPMQLGREPPTRRRKVRRVSAHAHCH